MGKEQNIELDEEKKDGVQGEETDDETEKNDEFEYDDDGNIIIPDVIEDEDQGDDGGGLIFHHVDGISAQGFHDHIEQA